MLLDDRVLVDEKVHPALQLCVGSCEFANTLLQVLNVHFLLLSELI